MGDDGNEITIYISKPKEINKNIPAMVHLHGILYHSFKLYILET